MNFEKLTAKSVEAINLARDTALQRCNSTIECSHVLFALLSDKEGLVRQIFAKAGADVARLKEIVQSLVDSLPTVSGSGYSPERI